MKIVLIGDSIRMGYQPLVRERVGRRAEVWGPEANCGNSMLIREHLGEWALEQRADVIHFNAGIHDLGWMPGETVPRFTVSAYARNLRLVVQRLRAGTSARLIWATTTPFLVPMDKRPKERCRIPPIVARYNAAAVRVMAAAGVEINDLYAAILDACIHDCLGDDKLHMSPHGNAVLADAVTRAVLNTEGTTQ